MNADGSNVVNLTNNHGAYRNRMPKWSPDGTKITFMSNRSNGGAILELFVMNADGSNVQQLTFLNINQRANFTPVFTKDGNKIVFVLESLAANASTLNSINVDGSDLYQITALSDAAAEEYMGDLNPNNTQMVFLDFAFSALSNIY